MFTKLLEGVFDYFRAKEMEVVLADLSDATLDDIGLTRADLSRIAVQPEASRSESVRSTGSLFALPLAPFAKAA